MKYLCDADVNTGIKACALQVENNSSETVGSVTLVPADCELVAGAPRVWSFDGSTTSDLGHTYLHELGHILGLRHTNRTTAECGTVSGNNPDGNTGVMRSTNGASLSRFRHWRRDDLDGIDHLWDSYYPSYELASWPDEGFPDLIPMSAASSLTGASVIRSGSLADAPPGAPQPLVTLDDRRRVVFATLADDDSVIEAPAVVEPGPLGKTVGNPEIALGDDGEGERVFVAWTANEQPDVDVMQTRWALRELGGGPWTITAGFDLKTSRVVAGFDPASNNWLLGTLSEAGEPRVSVIGYGGELLLESAELGGLTSYEIGNPVCRESPGCTMLLSTSELGGPSLARVDFAVFSDPPSVFVQSMVVFDEQDVYGRTSLASADPGSLHGLAGWQRFELGAAANDSPNPVIPPLFSAQNWPLGLGAYTDDQAMRSHRLALPLEVACGNGIVQAAEACDDGNLQPGDGCDDTCALEFVGGETGGTGDAGGDFDDDEACQCALERRDDGRGLGLVFVGMGVCGAAIYRRRRRRRRRELLHPGPAASAQPDQVGHGIGAREVSAGRWPVGLRPSE
ncbi:DUF4215 domain-containing protein [Enhygromyxa salina]|nr:DUF4215 domain-containing protein [Enhygromyxa salina]